MYHDAVARFHEKRWLEIGTIFAAHIDGLAAQGSFDDDVRSALVAAGDNARQGTPHTGSTVQASVAFDERLDALVPVQLRGAASMGRGAIEVVHTACRMILRQELVSAALETVDLASALQRLAGAHIVTMLPLYGDGQPLQPTTLASLIGGYTGPMRRAVEQINVAVRIVDQSPMGAGSGTSSRFAPDRRETAKRLGFTSPIENVVDAVSAVDFLIVSASAIEAVSSAINRLLREIQQLTIIAPDALVFADDQIERLPDVPQLRIQRVLERCMQMAAGVRQSAASARAFAEIAAPGPQREIDTPLIALLDACLVVRELASDVRALCEGGFDVNRAALGNRAGKGYLTSSDIVDFLVIEEGISPGDARLIAQRVLAQIRDRGLEIAAIDREMIDMAGLLIVGREIGIEFETLSKYLAPRRFLEGRTALGAPSPDSSRDWIKTESLLIEAQKRILDAHLERWNAISR